MINRGLGKPFQSRKFDSSLNFDILIEISHLLWVSLNMSDGVVELDHLCGFSLAAGFFISVCLAY